MPAGVTSLLRDLIVTPTLRSLGLTRIAGVTSSLILHAASTLDSVMLYRTNARDEAGSATPSFIPALQGSDPSCLQKLSIIEIRENPWTSVLGLDLHQYLRGLRDLDLSVSPPVVNWSRLLQKSDAATTLQRFELTFQSSLPVVDLPLFPALRSLKFQFDIPRQTLPLNLSHLLDSLPAAAPLLESLSIGTELRSVVRTVWYGDLEPYAPFASVDFVKRLPHFQKLKLSRTSFPIEDRFEEYVGHKFPGPREAGILTIDSSGYYGRCG
ncbi:hypothetical protein B0H14DRAFT_2752641 [Mycena olivaceomarginata]|nr:hypothetical protein B0H14DRAFT_2752641 [Mycena olivaceomarginata]